MIPRILPFGKGKEEAKGNKTKVEAGTQKEKEILGADGSHSEIPFQHVEIHVEGEAQKTIPNIPVGAFNGAGAEGEQEGEGVAEEIPGEFTIEDCEMICNSLINIPAVFIGDYLTRTPEQVKPFATQLYLYCVKKGIDPMSYFFDEFGLVIAGANLAGGMYKSYREHQEEEEKKKEEEIEYKNGKKR